MRQIASSLFFCFLIYSYSFCQESPLKVGVDGLTHGHVHWVFQSQARGDIEIVGIAESNQAVIAKFAAQYGFSLALVKPTLEEIFDHGEIEAVVAFGSIYRHLAVVQACAPRKIHVMVEKPLAVSLAHAEEMQRLAKQHEIHLITNYETTWYPTHHEAFDLLQADTLIGEIRKIIVRDGHRGPKKIGVSDEFLEWLTDPVLNGGGAIIDFGCYGANLVTWLMKGKKPISVTAVTQQLQKSNNPHVDDEANIILTYDDAVAIIQASWNWPIGRKDLEIYGLLGTIIADNRHQLRIRIAEGYDGYDEKTLQLEERDPPYHDPFVFLRALIRDDRQMPEYDLSSLENNMVVMEILEAAIRSAESGRTVDLKK